MSQRQALAEHNACTGVDYMNGTDVGLGHSVIAKLVAEMVDANCTGVYILREKRVISNQCRPKKVRAIHGNCLIERK